MPLIARGVRVLPDTRFQHLLKEIDGTHCEGQMPARVQATPVCYPWRCRAGFGRRIQDVSRYEVVEDHIKEGTTEEEVSLLDLS